jgi:uncharacterized protein YqjF (DUF2071 family)
MHPAFARVEHRPWPPPAANWAWRQSWLDLLFAHWPVPAAAVRKLVPPGLAVDEFHGTTWVGVVPFRMAGVMRRPFPDVPWISEFPELNLRLYVERDGRPGVWFLSLDAGNSLAVWGGRRWFHLPYFRARMSLAPGDGRLVYRSRRSGPSPIRFEAEYGPISEPGEAQPGTLEHWLTERYCLYSRGPDGCLYRGEFHHVPWPLQTAEATIRINDLPAPHGLILDGPPALLHFAKRLDVVLWPLERIAEPCRKAERLPAQVRPAFGGA